MNFVVIGGDAAGMSAASKAKRNNPDIHVTVFEKTEDVSYSACGMPYNIADPDRDIHDLVVRDAQTFIEKQAIDLRLQHEVSRIDRDRKKVIAVDNVGAPVEVPYDKLLIATGGEALIPDLPGFDLPGVMALKNLADGERLKAYIQSMGVKKAVVIGMGYIGLEMCEALHSLNIEVDMIKNSRGFLPWIGQEISDVIQSEVEARGVRLHMGYPVERVEKNGDGLRVVCDGLSLDGDMVMVAIGIRPRSELAAEAGLDLGQQNTISVDRQCRTSDPDIYSAGDCADAYDVITGTKTWIPLALRANRAGWAVADHICGKPVHLEGVVGTSVFKVFDLQVARTGLSDREATAAGFDPVDVVVKTRSRALPGAHRIWIRMIADKPTGRLLGVQMTGKEGVAHRINSAAVALHNHMTVRQLSQCDFAYAPPFGPVWDPVLKAAMVLQKSL